MKKGTNHENITTTDHDEIKSWVEKRDGYPARIKISKEKNQNPEEAGILRIGFEKENDSLEEISWDEFFEIFDNGHLVFLYQNKTESGGQSRYFKLING